MASVKVTSVVVVMCMVVLVGAEASITCKQATKYLSPCYSYLEGGSGPSKSCCNGVKNLNSAAKSTSDRQATCKCLKSAASSLKGLSVSNSKSLASKCGVNLPYKITPSLNCSTYVDVTLHHSL